MRAGDAKRVHAALPPWTGGTWPNTAVSAHLFSLQTFNYTTAIYSTTGSDSVTLSEAQGQMIVFKAGMIVSTLSDSHLRAEETHTTEQTRRGDG